MIDDAGLFADRLTLSASKLAKVGPGDSWTSN
jgi:hypothetical protein